MLIKIPLSLPQIPQPKTMQFFSLLLLSLFIFTTPLHSSSPHTLSPPHFIKSIPSSSLHNRYQQQYFELTHPLPTDQSTPSCSVSLLNHSFADTYGQPPVTAHYSPPSKCTTWSHAVLEFKATCKGDQYDRIAAVWLDGAELLRTSTAEPTEDGIFWKVRKDVTRYSSLLSQSNLILTVMLENLVNDEFTGVYHVNISILYYTDIDNGVKFPLSAVSNPKKLNKLNRKLGFVENHEIENKLGFKSSLNVYETPADLIIPISGIREEGFWFRIQNDSDVHTKGIQIPANTRKAVIELYVSFHGDDEFWYSNPPDSYVKLNNLTTGRANGAYREVLVTIDENLVGSVIPFPVIFTGGINPLFWEPVVSIGAFDLPSYDFDLTPFLGLLLDEKVHSFGLGVADSISFWLVDANLHLWLDHDSDKVQAMSVDYKTPSLSIERDSKFKLLDGSFEIESKRKSRFVGWVNSTAGNLTTRFYEEVKFKNSIKFKNNGTGKVVEQKIRTKTETRIESDAGNLISRLIVKRKYPLRVTINNLPKSENNTSVMITNVVQEMREKSSNGEFSSSLNNKQNCSGWMLVEDHSVLSGAAETHQKYDYKDELGCYSRVVLAVNGNLVQDNTASLCAASF